MFTLSIIGTYPTMYFILKLGNDSNSWENLIYYYCLIVKWSKNLIKYFVSDHIATIMATLRSKPTSFDYKSKIILDSGYFNVHQ